MKYTKQYPDPNSIEARLMRIETRVCLIMEALGLDPNERGNKPKEQKDYDKQPLSVWRIFGRHE